MAKSINIDELNNAITGVLREYNEKIVIDLKKNTEDAMKDLIKQTRDTAPVGNRDKHYKNNITSKTLSQSNDGITKLWYVKGSDYRLSHLLNNGHALRDGGRYPGTNFIGEAVDAIIPVYLEKIEEALRNG